MIERAAWIISIIYLTAHKKTPLSSEKLESYFFAEWGKSVLLLYPTIYEKLKKNFLTLEDDLKFEWSASISYYVMPYIKLG